MPQDAVRPRGCFPVLPAAGLHCDCFPDGCFPDDCSPLLDDCSPVPLDEAPLHDCFPEHPAAGLLRDCFPLPDGYSLVRQAVERLRYCEGHYCFPARHAAAAPPELAGQRALSLPEEARLAVPYRARLLDDSSSPAHEWQLLAGSSPALVVLPARAAQVPPCSHEQVECS